MKHITKLLLVIGLTLPCTPAFALPGWCSCKVTFSNGASPAFPVATMTGAESSCNSYCSNASVGNLECGVTAIRWYQFVSGNYQNTMSSVSGACTSATGTAGTQPGSAVCPINNLGLYGTATLAPSNCKVVAYQNGTNGGVAGVVAGEPYCNLPVGSESCYTILQCNTQGRDTCAKSTYGSINTQSAETPLVCAAGFNYVQNGNGLKDTCIKPVVVNPVKPIPKKKDLAAQPVKPIQTEVHAIDAAPTSVGGVGNAALDQTPVKATEATAVGTTVNQIQIKELRPAGRAEKQVK